MGIINIRKSKVDFKEYVAIHSENGIETEVVVFAQTPKGAMMKATAELGKVNSTWKRRVSDDRVSVDSGNPLVVWTRTSKNASIVCYKKQGAYNKFGISINEALKSRITRTTL